MKISVAMCTYNGALYLAEQLKSIANQTRLPNELIVCDDGSTDDTLSILKKFNESSPFTVKMYCNRLRLGPTKNFEQAIQLCNGDIIFLSDQDDVWLPGKLEKLMKVFEDYPKAGYVFSDALVVDNELNPLGYTMWERILFTGRQRLRFRKGHQLEILLKHNVVTGATMAFRSELRDWILPIPDQWIHDAWIALLVSAITRNGFFVEEPLIYYRQHPKQLIGGLKVGFFQQIQKAFSTEGEIYNYEKTIYLQVIERLKALGINDQYIDKLIKAKIQHLEARSTLYESSFPWRIKIMAQEVVTRRYHRFSNCWKSIAKDLFVSSSGYQRS